MKGIKKSPLGKHYSSNYYRQDPLMNAKLREVILFPESESLNRNTKISFKVSPPRYLAITKGKKYYLYRREVKQTSP